MAVCQNDNDGLVLAALAFMDGYGIGQRYFIQLGAGILHVLFGITHINKIIGSRENFSRITVEYAFLIVVLLLHNFVADTKNRFARSEFPFIRSGRIHPLLDKFIKSINAAGLSVHGGKNLNGKFVAAGLLRFSRIKFGNCIGTGMLLFYFKKTELPVPTDDRHGTAVNTMGIGDDDTAFFLPENRFETYDRYRSGSDNIMQDGTGADGRQLVRITDENTAAMRLQSLQEIICQLQVKHRYFIYNEEIRF